jgi:glutathione S-transferase
MLDHKQLSYRRFDLIPGPHVTILKMLGFPYGTVPALKIAGERIQSTGDAAHAIDRACPGRSLFPSDPDHKRLVEDITDWARQTLAPIKNDLYWWGVRCDPDAAVGLWEKASTGVPKFLLRRAVPRSVRKQRRSEPPDIEAGLRCLAAVPSLLERIDSSIASGIIGGAQINAGDFHAGMVARLLMSLTDLESRISGRPAGQLASRTYPEPIPPVAPFLTSEQIRVLDGLAR